MVRFSRRQTVTFVVIALLLVVFVLIALWGMVESDWLYGTYGGIGQAHWERITHLREQLRQLDIAPQALALLDDALLLPHPSDEQALADLRRAALALDPYSARPDVRRIQAELYALISEIRPGFEATSTPWSSPTPQPSPTLTPIVGAPIARRDAPEP